MTWRARDPDEDPYPRERGVRVFVSSTFRDMQAEREELVKRAFPRLRKLCESRGAAWGEVDLRWGITDEQKAEGKVLPICLEEIRRCRPYFLGLLGERYGWVPTEIPPHLIQLEPWLAEHRGRSVTELEILHGVLNDPAMADHAFFYLRSPAYLERLPPSERRHHRERPSREEVEELGGREARRHARDRRRKLRALKERLRSSGLPVREYADPRELGELVAADLTAVIDRLFPEGEEVGLLQRDIAEHEAFARSRARVYIADEAVFEALDRHVFDDGPPLVVVGESGIGKSALLANWALWHRERHPDRLILVHFVGTSSRSTSWTTMLKRFQREFLDRLGFLTAPEKETPQTLRNAFALSLQLAAATGRVVLVLDGLNQLEDRDQALDLVWLPRELPPQVRVVASTLPGRPLDELRRRGCTELEIRPLDDDRRGRLVELYLAHYSKTLDPELVRRIVEAPAAGNPLYLRALLEELRLWGEHETLPARVAHCLSAATVPELYRLILERYEADYEADRPGLVGDALRLLWAARRGLSHTELLDLLGSGGEPLPGAHWSPLYLALDASLIDRSGLLGFSHDFLRQAVRDRYLPDDRARQSAHLALADYFVAREVGIRKIEETPWQLVEASAWDRLARLLADAPFLTAAWEADELEVRSSWARLEAQSDVDRVETYRTVLESPADHDPIYVHQVAQLIEERSLGPARALHAFLVDHFRAAGSTANLAASLANEAICYLEEGDLDRAASRLEEAEHLFSELGLRARVAQCQGNRGMIEVRRGRAEAALELFRRQEALCRETGDRESLPTSLSNQAAILSDRQELEAALALLDEAERICRETGNRETLASCLGNRAAILRQRGDYAGALELLEECERICRDIGNQRGLVQGLGSRAMTLRRAGDLDRSLAVAEEQERVARALAEPHALQDALLEKALTLAERGQADRALAALEEGEAICRLHGLRTALKVVLGRRAALLHERGELEGALAAFREADAIAVEIGDTHAHAKLLGCRAQVVAELGDLDGGLELWRQEEQLLRERGDLGGLVTCLDSQATAHSMRQDPAAEREALVAMEAACRELGDRKRLLDALVRQAQIHNKAGDIQAEFALLEEAEGHARAVGNRSDLALSQMRRGLILYEWGRQTEALVALRESLDLKRERGDPEEIQRTLCMLAVVVYANGQGDFEEAMGLLAEQEAICRQLPRPKPLVTCLLTKGLVLMGAVLDGERSLDELALVAREAYETAVRNGLTAQAQQVRALMERMGIAP